MEQLALTQYLQTLSSLTLSMEATDKSCAPLNVDEAARIAQELLINVRSAGGKVMLIGNGGSSAIASHAQNDLSESALARAMVFTEAPVLTARSNDHGYHSVFERPVRLWAEPGDLLYAISSSGESQNIVKAVEAGIQRRCSVITLTGFNPDNPARKLGDINFYVKSDVYGYVESAHTSLTHYLTTGLPPAGS